MPEKCRCGPAWCHFLLSSMLHLQLRCPPSPKPRRPRHIFSKVAQRTPWKDPPLGYEVFARLGQRGVWASTFWGWASRFWPEGRPRGPAEGGKGGGKPPPLTSSKHSDQGSTDLEHVREMTKSSVWDYLCFLKTLFEDGFLIGI